MSALTLSFIILVLCFALPDNISYLGRQVRVHKTINIKATFILFLLACLAAFRASNVGNDTEGYINLYNDIRYLDWRSLEGMTSRFEIGYLYLNHLLTNISTNAQIILIVSSAFCYFFYWKFIKKYSTLIGISLFVFFFARYHDSSMNIVRQVMATGFVLWSYLELKKGRNLWFIILVLLAYSMHKSSIVFLLALPFSKFQFRTKYTKYFLITCGVTFVVGGSIIAFLLSRGLIPSYYEDSDYLAGGKIAPALILVIDILIWLLYYQTRKSRLKATASCYPIASDIMWMLMLTIIFQILGLYFSNMMRVAWYFRLFELIALPYAISTFHGRRRTIVTICVVIFFLLYYLIVLYYRPEWNMVYPYHFFFMK